MKTPEEFADEMRDVRDYPERLAPWRRRRAAIAERDAEHATTLATVTAERDALKRDLAGESAGNAILRGRHGAREDETFPAFVDRLAAERDAARDALRAAMQWARENHDVVALSAVEAPGWYIDARNALAAPPPSQHGTGER